MRTMSRNRMRGASLVTALALAATGGTAVALPAPLLAAPKPAEHSAKPSLRVTKVSARDDKSIDITFNKALGDDIRQFTAANTAYAGQYITLDGQPLSQIAGTTVRPVDTPDRRTLRVVLGGDTRLEDRTYKIRFDGGQDTLADLFFRAADGGVLPGTSTAEISFRGTAKDAAPVAVASAAVRDARTVEVTFGTSIWSGMPRGAYGQTDIALKDGDTTVHPVYVEHVPGTDQRTYRLFFGADLDRGAAYRLSLAPALRLTGSGGTAAEAVESDVRAGGGAYAPPRIAGATAGEQGDEITIRFTRRIAKVRSGGEDLAVKETVTGISGATLTDDEVRGFLRFPGLTTDRGVPFAQALRSDAAYFPDATTLVVRLDSGHRLKPGGHGSVAVDKGALIDVTGAASTSTGDTRVAIPGRFKKPGDDFDPKAPDYLKVDTHATTVFQRYDYTVSEDGVSVRREGVFDKVVGQTIKTVVVENKYVKATFAPGYGARLLSMIYKPTGHDLFYLNPVGTPYGHSSTPPGTPGNSPFYQNWLMVWGGVFPTLTEAEHGKYWNVPWDFSIDRRKNTFAITMTNTDTVDYPYKPTRYVYGATGIKTAVTYALDAKRPTLDMTVSLHNPGDQDRKFEYWTCTTLAPGEDTYDGSPTMSIVSPVKKIYRDPGYRWMEDKEEPAGQPGDGMLKFDTLKKMSEWDRSGIAYGQDLATMPQGDWWGVVNHENSEGVVRVGDNKKTPGLKLWEWGQNASFDTNPYSKGNSARPYIELWAGASDKFFSPATLKAGQTLSWTETYLPTMDLGDITNATAHGAADVKVDASGNVRGRVFPTDIGQRLRATLVDVSTGRTIDTENFTAGAHTAVKLDGKVAPGGQAKLILTDDAGRTLLTAESGL